MKSLIYALLLVPLIAVAQATDAERKRATDRALHGIATFSNAQEKKDPHYRTVEKGLLKELDDILASNPPDDWVRVIRVRYVALSEAAHASERDAITADERRVFGLLGPGDHGWAVRSAQLEDRLKSGELGPREHALRMAEAAKLYHATNDLVIAWRAAKVPIATDYEMGLITRSQYEERWNRTTAMFLDRQAADDRAQLQAQPAVGYHIPAAREATIPFDVDAFRAARERDRARQSEHQAEIRRALDAYRASQGTTCRQGPTGSWNCR
jgi:hypothetical protein